MSISIAKALKEKNRIAGRIAKLQAQVYTSNKFTDKKSPDIKADVLLAKLKEEWQALIDLKNDISIANAGISYDLVRLTEAKAELTFWNNFRHAGQATEVEESHEYQGNVYVKVESNVYHTITSLDVLLNQERLQTLIDSLQDRIDLYNATTLI